MVSKHNRHDRRTQLPHKTKRADLKRLSLFEEAPPCELPASFYSLVNSSSYELPPSSDGGQAAAWRLEPKYKKRALIKIALAEALRNFAFSVFRLKPLLWYLHLRLKTEAIHKKKELGASDTTSEAGDILQPAKSRAKEKGRPFRQPLVKQVICRSLERKRERDPVSPVAVAAAA